jgi:cytochrome c oxidase cbb3-type subunit I/II
MRQLVVATVGLTVCGIVGTAPVWAEEGKDLYAKNCVTCHGAAGKGDGPAAKAMKTKPQDFAVGLKGKSDADITKTLKEGVVGTEGKATHPKMTKLSDDDLQKVVQYIKHLGGL